MVVPVLVIQLNEPHAALGQAPGQQAVRGEGAVAGLAAVQIQDVLGLLAGVHQIGNAGLHLEGHLVLRDPRGDFRIVHDGVVLGIDRVGRLHHVLLLVAGDAGRVAQVQHRVAAAAQGDALEPAGQKPRRPLPRRDGLVLPAAAQGGEHHETGQILGFAAQAVHDPGAHRGPPGDLRTGVDEHVRRIVIDGFRGHGPHEADFVGGRADLLEQFADLRPGVELLELQLRAVADEFGALQLRQLLALGHALRHRLAVHLGQHGLVVEGLQVGRSAGHRQPDHAFGFGGEVRRLQHAAPAPRCGSGQQLRIHQRAQGHRAQPGGGQPQEAAPADVLPERRLRIVARELGKSVSCVYPPGRAGRVRRTEFNFRGQTFFQMVGSIGPRKLNSVRLSPCINSVSPFRADSKSLAPRWSRRPARLGPRSCGAGAKPTFKIAPAA